MGGPTSLIGFEFNVLDCVLNSGIFSNMLDPEIIVNDLIDYLFPESIDTDRFNYFYQDIFLDGMMPYNWTNAWMSYLNDQDDSVVKPRLEQLFTYVINSPEFQTF